MISAIGPLAYYGYLDCWSYSGQTDRDEMSCLPGVCDYGCVVCLSFARKSARYIAVFRVPYHPMDYSCPPQTVDSEVP